MSELEKEILELIQTNFPNASDITLELIMWKLQDLKLTSEQRGYQKGLSKGAEYGKIQALIERSRPETVKNETGEL